MSGLPWLRLDNDGNPYVEKVDPFEAAAPSTATSTGPTSTPPGPLRPLVDIAVEALEQILRRLDEVENVDDLCAGWESVREVGDAAQTAAWHLAGRIGDALGGRHDRWNRTLRDGRRIDYSPGERRVFDRDKDGALVEKLRSAALSDRRVDETTGEIEPPDVAVLRVLRDVALLEWRASALRSYGIRPDDYSDMKAGRPSVRIK